jgi:hypothetical protein
MTRTAQVGEDRLVATRIPRGSWLVRAHRDGQPYDRMIVVTPRWRVIHLMGWIGNPFSIDWRAARDALFPRGRLVRWERLQKDGALKPHELRL